MRRCRLFVGVRHALLLIVALLDAVMLVPVVLITDALLAALLVSPVIARDVVLLTVVQLDVVLPTLIVQNSGALSAPVVLLAAALLGAPLVHTWTQARRWRSMSRSSMSRWWYWQCCSPVCCLTRCSTSRRSCR